MQLAASILLGAFLALVLLAFVTRLIGFRAQRPLHYAKTTPPFDIREQLSGTIQCEGVIYGPTGRVASRFVADIEGRWEGNSGILREHFRYDSGTVQQREWRLTLGRDGSIRAEAADIVGTGVGHQAGSAVNLRYRIRLPAEAGGYLLDTNDWMYLIENGTIINHSQFRKYGIKVAELVATMRKKHP